MFYLLNEDNNIYFENYLGFGKIGWDETWDSMWVLFKGGGSSGVGDIGLF